MVPEDGSGGLVDSLSRACAESFEEEGANPGTSLISKKMIPYLFKGVGPRLVRNSSKFK
jgi:hypothetical protein